MWSVCVWCLSLPTPLRTLPSLLSARMAIERRTATLTAWHRTRVLPYSRRHRRVSLTVARYSPLVVPSVSLVLTPSMKRCYRARRYRGGMMAGCWRARTIHRARCDRLRPLRTQAAGRSARTGKFPRCRTWPVAKPCERADPRCCHASRDGWCNAASVLASVRRAIVPCEVRASRLNGHG